MIDPISASLTAGSWAFSAIGGKEAIKDVADSVVGNMLDRWMCERYPQVQEIFRRTFQEPRNYDLARAVRRSQLLALMLCVDAYKTMPRDREFGYAADYMDDIAEPLTQWLRRALAEKDILDVDVSALSDARKQLWRERWDTVQDKIHRAFLDPKPHQGSAFDRQEDLRRLAETWILDEASVWVADSKKGDWPRFVQLVAPTTLPRRGKFAGWWRLFQALIAEEVKNNPKVRDILAAQKLAEILEVQIDLKKAVEALQVGLEDVLARMNGALNELREASRDLQNAAFPINAALDNVSAAFTQVVSIIMRVENKLDDQQRYSREIDLRKAGIRRV